MRTRDAVKPQRRESSFLPRSIDEGERTIEATIATATPVRRFFGDEILSFRDGAINTARIVGMPLLDSHRRDTVDAVIGRVESFRIERESERLIATIRFANNARGRSAFDLVRDGMLTRMSIGYSLDEVEDSAARRNGKSVTTVVRWTPYEVSLVGVPADNNAKIRGATPMDPEDENEVLENEQRPAPRGGRDDRRIEASRRAERAIEGVRSQLVTAGLAEADVDDAMEDVATPTQAREIGFRMLAERSLQTSTRPNSNSGRHESGAGDVRERATEAIAVRLGAPIPQGSKNNLIGAPLADIVRQVREAEGVRTGRLTDSQAIDEAFFGMRASHTTSDFPAMFVDGANRAALDRFGANPSVLKPLATKKNQRDFRPSTYIRPGEWPKLQKVLEDGEIKYGTFGFETQGHSVASFGIALRVSRQMLINDDLGVFADAVAAAGASAADAEADLFWDVLAANSFGGGKLSDGKNFFHADHGNLAGSGTALDIANLSAARESMRLQKNVSGTGNAGSVPAIIVVGPKLETTAEKLVAEISANTTAEVNPFAGKLRVAVENRYGGLGWWVFADPQVRPALVYGYLDGFEGPRIRTEEPFGTQGFAMSCEMDFGCGPYDYRAAYRNPGT